MYFAHHITKVFLASRFLNVRSHVSIFQAQQVLKGLFKSERGEKGIDQEKSLKTAV